MFHSFNTSFLKEVKEFINTLSASDQAKISASEDSMKTGDFTSVRIKTLRGPIKELIVRRRRLLFCLEGNVIYFLHGFTKKTTKTPKHEIDRAERMSRSLISYLQDKKQK